MKKFLGLLVAIAMPTLGLADIILQQSFETAAGWTASAEFNDTTNDHFGDTDGSDISNIDGAYTGADGNRYMAGEDQDDAGDPNNDGLAAKIVTLDQIDISAYTGITLSGLFAAGANAAGVGASFYDSTDFMLVEFSLDSAPFQDGIMFSFVDPGGGDFSNEPLANDTNFDGNGDGLVLGTAFRPFGTSIADGSTLDIRITTSLNSGTEEAAYDNILVEGTLLIPEPSSLALLGMSLLGLFAIRRRR